MGIATGRRLVALRLERSTVQVPVPGATRKRALPPCGALRDDQITADITAFEEDLLAPDTTPAEGGLADKGQRHYDTMR